MRFLLPIGGLGVCPALLVLVQGARLLIQACLGAGGDDGLQQAVVIVVVGMSQDCLNQTGSKQLECGLV